MLHKMFRLYALAFAAFSPYLNTVMKEGKIDRKGREKT